MVKTSARARGDKMFAIVISLTKFSRQLMLPQLVSGENHQVSYVDRCQSEKLY